MAIALRLNNQATPGQNNCLLNAYPEVMMDSTWHFNQVTGQGAPFNTAANQGGSVYLQQEREYIARSLESALIKMADELNYWPRPAWFQEELPLGRGVPMRNQTHQTRWMKMIALGSRATTVIQAAATVAYSDPNQTGVKDLATITVANPGGYSVDEIQLYFKVADGSPTAGDQRYRIEPVQVVSSGGNLVITGHRALFVKPSIWATPYDLTDPNINQPNAANTANTNDFVTEVDVYRVYTDDTSAIQLLSADGTVLQSFTGDIEASEISIFRMGWDACACWSACKRPQRLVVNYYAGVPLAFGNMDSELLEAIVMLANARMVSEFKGMSHWTKDLWQKHVGAMVTTTGVQTSILTQRTASSGWGARYGEVMAWLVAVDRRIEKGGKLTRMMW